MRVRNNTVANQSVYAKVLGKGNTREYITVVGEATLEIDDKVWLEKYADPCKALLEAGTLEITKAPKKTDEQIAEEKAKALAAAKKLVAASEKAGK